MNINAEQTSSKKKTNKQHMPSQRRAFLFHSSRWILSRTNNSSILTSFCTCMPNLAITVPDDERVALRVSIWSMHECRCGCCSWWYSGAFRKLAFCCWWWCWSCSCCCFNTNDKLRSGVRQRSALFFLPFTDGSLSRPKFDAKSVGGGNSWRVVPLLVHTDDDPHFCLLLLQLGFYNITK